MSIAMLREHFESMAALPESAEAADKRRRGQQFEVFLKDLLGADSLSPRIRIRPDGEEIDGSFVLNDRVFLLEAKWHAPPLPASSIYQFKGKVDGKLVGTLGVFISISGFSKDAVDALTVGKNLNVVLFDRSDIEAAIENSFRTVLLAKLRVAAEEGVVYFPFRTSLASPDSKEVRVVEETGKLVANEVIVIVEGQTDEKILAELTNRIIQFEGLSANIRFLVAGGKQAITRLASVANRMGASQKSLIIVADTDGDRYGTERLLSANLPAPVASMILIEPEIEAWFFPGIENPRAALREAAQRNRKSLIPYANELAKNLNIEELKKLNVDFAAYYEAIVCASKSAKPGSQEGLRE